MTAETTRIWMYENRERWNEYQRNRYKRNKEKKREHQLNCQIISTVHDSAESASSVGTDCAIVRTDA
jgi:hypothetical protein